MKKENAVINNSHSMEKLKSKTKYGKLAPSYIALVKDISAVFRSTERPF